MVEAVNDAICGGPNVIGNVEDMALDERQHGSALALMNVEVQMAEPVEDASVQVMNHFANVHMEGEDEGGPVAPMVNHNRISTKAKTAVKTRKERKNNPANPMMGEAE